MSLSIFEWPHMVHSNATPRSRLFFKRNTHLPSPLTQLASSIRKTSLAERNWDCLLAVPNGWVFSIELPLLAHTFSHPHCADVWRVLGF